MEDLALFLDGDINFILLIFKIILFFVLLSIISLIDVKELVSCNNYTMTRIIYGGIMLVVGIGISILYDFASLLFMLINYSIENPMIISLIIPVVLLVLFIIFLSSIKIINIIREANNRPPLFKYLKNNKQDVSENVEEEDDDIIIGEDEFEE